MARLFIIAAISASVLALSACATTANPEKVCTADWIDKRSSKAMGNIERKAKPALRKLGKAAESWAAGKKPGPLQLWSLQGSVNSLTKELQSGRGMRDLKTLAKTCNDPKIVTSAMTNMMRDNGLSQGMIDFVERLPQYRDIILKDLSDMRGQPVAAINMPQPQMMHH